MKRMQVVLVLLGGVAMLMGGCSKSLDGSSYNYASGNLSATLNADVEKSYNAALKAMEQLQLTPTEKSKDALGARILAKTSADKKVKVTLTRVTDTTTELVVGIGTVVGDKDIAKTVYDKITENLKQP
jgi:hypothetical protein